MSKELFVSSTPHQTKVALVENDLLSEVYFERENEYTLAGSIYKGRVTRVLPGMQSAFVDIGLERDAFLYVSDFFEMEDEDESFEPIPAKPYEVKPSEPRPEPVQLSRAESVPAVFEGGFGEDVESESTDLPATVNAAERSEEAGGRRWRGRRRRRGGGRDRGFPENKFAHPENGSPATEAEEEEPAAEIEAAVQEEVPKYKPIILPGESIAKFNRKSEPEAGSAADTEAVPEHEQAAPRDDRRPRYGRDRDRDRDRNRTREHESESDRPYAPIVLPGESISKYRNVQPQSLREVAQTPAELTEAAALAEEETPQHAHEAIIAPEAMDDLRPQPKDELTAWSPAQETAAHIEALPKDEASVIPPIVEEEEIEETHHHAATEPVEDAHQHEFQHHEFQHHEFQHEAPQQEAVHRYEQMNVASVFGGAETEPGNAVEAENETEEAHEFSASSEAQAIEDQHHDEQHGEELEHESSREMPSYHQAPAGSFEEEEFEADEEDDLPHPAEVLFENEDYEELEEETLEPMEHAATELVQAMNETGAIREIQGGYEGDDEEENGDLDEIERAAYAEIGEPEAASAELRGPSGTAGLQQRTNPRPPFDRQRGRRGGRRMGRGAPRRESLQSQHVMISDVLKEGQEVLVQIAKEPIGKKGARITSHIALPGRFLVYMPTVNHVGVSRKINSEEERMRLKRIVTSERENGHGGFIVRTAAANISEEDLRNDIRFLKSLWHDIRTRADSSKSPALIYHDLNLVERIMRDLVTQDFTAIWSDTEQEYERINRFISRFQPGLVRRVKLYTKEMPLFEQFGIDAEINKALKSKVWLKSGGYIVINQTEALVAIDINTGKYVGKTSRLEDTIFKTNVDAIKEIVRQIRLRDLGGIIVIDFIDMDERKNRQKVMQALEEEMKADRAPSKVLQFNDFGLVAITRKRVKQSLERTLGSPCPYCTGNGYVKSPSTICNEIYVEMRKMAKQFDSDILLRVNPEVAKALKGNNGRWLMEMEELTGHNILIKSDPTLHQEQFDM
jgi:Rne/Rng family ribonuclease